MKRAIVVAILAALGAVAAVASAETPPPAEVPFPSPKTDVFVFAATYASTGEQNNVYKAGETVRFMAFAADVKTKKVVTPETARFFYITIPGEPNLKLTYGKVGSRLLWSGTWTVPATHPLGLVQYKVLVQTKAKNFGSFVQPAVAGAQLTIEK